MKRSLTALLFAAVVFGALASPVTGEPKGLSGLIGGPRGVSTGGLFTEPSDAAFYRGGAGGPPKLFVVEAADDRNARVQRLDRHGNFELAWGRDAIRGGARGDTGRGFEICSASVSGAAGCQAAPAGGRAGELRKPTAVAVSEATGDVYVMDSGNRRVQRFGSGGRFRAVWGWGVASGAPRFERCTQACRAGRVGAGDAANAGQFGMAETGAIAVAPSPPHHVFVGDEGNNRVFEFESDGRFVRGWGWGVATGSDRFEVCGPRLGRCGTGRSRPLGGDWPRHLAVDEDGVVYASEAGRDSDVLRFESTPSPDSTRAGAAVRPPLRVKRHLSAGLTLGIAVNFSTRTLAVGRDPFGPMTIDELPLEGMPRIAGERSRGRIVQDSLPYLGSVNGIEAGRGNIYVAKSTRLNSNDPSTGLDSCRGPRGPRTCNGLAVVSASGAPTMKVVASAMSLAPVHFLGAASSQGLSRYRFQISHDGQVWTNIAPARYVSGVHPVELSGTVPGLRPARVYWARLMVTNNWDTGKGVVVSNSVAFVAGR